MRDGPTSLLIEAPPPELKKGYCYAMLILYYATLCYADVLWYAVLRCAGLCWAVQCCAVLCCAGLCTQFQRKFDDCSYGCAGLCGEWPLNFRYFDLSQHLSSPRVSVSSKSRDK